MRAGQSYTRHRCVTQKLRTEQVVVEFQHKQQVHQQEDAYPSNRNTLRVTPSKKRRLLETWVAQNSIPLIDQHLIRQGCKGTDSGKNQVASATALQPINHLTTTSHERHFKKLNTDFRPTQHKSSLPPTHSRPCIWHSGRSTLTVEQPQRQMVDGCCTQFLGCKGEP